MKCIDQLKPGRPDHRHGKTLRYMCSGAAMNSGVIDVSQAQN